MCVCVCMSPADKCMYSWSEIAHPLSVTRNRFSLCYCVCARAQPGLTKQSRGISIAGATKSFLPPSSLLPDPLSLTHMHTHLPTTEPRAGSTVPEGGRRGQWEWKHKRPLPPTTLPAKLQERSKPNCAHFLSSDTHRDACRWRTPIDS